MPIKLLEYLAAGRITLIADTPLYRSLFKSNFLPFFYNPGNAQYLHQRINVILNSENLAQKINDGVSFASQFTWEKRVSRMLGSLTLEGRN
jgi:glycosyltransferase involved in cell wall biosynthesis